MSDGVTIGQAARYVGVTVKTIRHYHRLGAVPEPERDRSGYRRYTSVDLLRLVQARTLAEAGVGIAEIGDLLAGSDEEFGAAVARVEEDLQARISELQRRRERLLRLRDGDRALLPPRAAAILDRLEELEFDPAFVTTQQEAMVLFRALLPEHFNALLSQQESRLADPEHVDILRRSWEAASWEPTDPRLDELATAAAKNLLAHPGHIVVVPPTPTETRSRVELVNRHRGETLPTVVVLSLLIEQRLRELGVALPDL